ncbi:MAG TPA: GAF domain-containing sensor histidine kinase [Puia sp.]|nr:GAF domain-containing sensor histidine kinase [Puia sp.]
MEYDYQNVFTAEKERIQVLKKYDILDTPPDGSFDRLVALGSKLLDMPIVIVSLVDTDRIWFKSVYGLDVRQIDREQGLCASAILSDEFYLVEDAVKDPRTLTNSLVAGSFGLRFYAAVPLKTVEGFILGTFCVIDKNPRQLTEGQKAIMHDLAAIIMDQMELRLAARKANAQQNQALNLAMHDLRNPLATIALGAELIKESTDEPEVIAEMCDKIMETSERMNKMIHELLESASLETGKIVLLPRRVDFAEVIKRTLSTNRALAVHKHQHLLLEIENHPVVWADELKLSEIADNLINNAIKFSPPHSRITVRVMETAGKAILKVADEGPGFTTEDRKHLFQRFSRLSAQPTGGEHSTGLGLSIVKTLVEAHEGRIYVESQEQGSVFTVELPLLV